MANFQVDASGWVGGAGNWTVALDDSANATGNADLKLVYVPTDPLATIDVTTSASASSIAAISDIAADSGFNKTGAGILSCNIWRQPVGFMIFWICALAECERLPFDLPEAEEELVAGYQTEYSGMKFGLFFVGEYIGMLLLSVLLPVLFFGGWYAPFGLDIPNYPMISGVFWLCAKTFAFVVFFILVRAALVRPRYDQLMNYGWLIMLPLSLLNLLVTGAVVLAQGN